MTRSMDGTHATFGGGWPGEAEPDGSLADLKRILLVLGNAAQCRLVQRQLRELVGKGLTVAAADCVTEAERLLAEDQTEYDAVIMDLILPDSAGIETLHRLEESLSRTPVFVVLQQADDRLSQKALQAGASDVLVRAELTRARMQSLLHYAREIRRRLVAETELAKNQHELKLARQIQRSLLPTSSPLLPNLEVAGMSRSATAVGGDYFDYLAMPRDLLGIVVADVMGHGLAPALLVGQAAACFRSLALSQTDPGRILSLANYVLTEGSSSERFITAQLLSIAWQNNEVRYANAGHPPAVMVGADGSVKAKLAEGGFPLALMYDTSYDTHQTARLADGDVIVLVSDGILEAQSEEGEMFGAERLVQAVQRSRQASAETIVENIFYAINLFCENSPQDDDSTAVVIKAV